MQSQKSCITLLELRNHSPSWFGLGFRALVGHPWFLFYQELKSINLVSRAYIRACTERSKSVHVLWGVFFISTGWCTCPHLETHPGMRTSPIFYYQGGMPPPYSPDLNPMDYSIWSILETKACAKTQTNIESLKASLKREWDEIPQETLRAAVEAFPRKLNAVTQKKGGYIE